MRGTLTATKILLAIYYFTQLLQYMILAYVLLSWFARPGKRLYDFYRRLGEILEPILAPFRRFTLPLAMRSGLDFTPFLAVIAISVMYRLIHVVMIGWFIR